MLTASNSPLSILLRLTRAIGSTNTVEEIYETALDALTDGLEVSRSAILLFDTDGVMRFKAHRGLSETYRHAVEGHTPWRPDTPNPEPVVVSNVSQDESLAPYLSTITGEGIAAMTFVPLVSQSRVIGKFMLYYDAPRMPSADELQLAAVIASQVALAVERTRTEDNAYSTSQRLAAIVESSGDAIVGKSLDGRITTWNRAAERMFGWAAAEAIGQSIRLIIPAERHTEEDGLLERVRRGEQVEMETVRQRKDGARLPVSLMVSPIRDARGRIVGVSTIARDISERARAEADRAELHRRLTTLVAASASVLHSLDRDSVLDATLSIARRLLVADAYALWSNDSASDEWHMMKGDSVSETFARRIVASPPSDERTAPDFPLRSTWAVTDVSTHPVLEPHLPAYRREGVVSMLVCPMRLGDDRVGSLVFYYRTRREFSDIDLESGQALANLAGAAIAAADLHDQLRTERNAVEVARSRAAFLVDATALLTRSLEYEKTLASVARLAVPEFSDWCAIDVTDQEGRLQRLATVHAHPTRIDPPDARVPDSVREVIRTGAPMMLAAGAPPHQASNSRAGVASSSFMSSLCVPIISPSGTLGAMTFVFGESARRYSDLDLDLARELAARSALAIENALAYRRVNEASRVKDEFLAMLSHELRTPLNAILGYAQMLTTGMLDAERHSHAMKVLMRNATALKQIIDDLLDVARITSGKVRLNMRPVDLADVLGAAAATIQPAAEAKGVSLEVAIDADAPRVLGDPDRLQQVVWNLLSNAAKFTRRGGRVRLELKQSDPWIEIVVADDGQGIDPAFLPHMFERFRQADGRYAREHAGLGLGLSIVRDLTELHGGTVLAKSEGPGRGATFTVRLPRPTGLASAVTGAREIRAFLPAARSDVSLKGHRVLVVDNEDDALGLLRAILEQAGAEVVGVRSADRALVLLQATSFDALIADIGTLEMDGLELIRTIRQTLPAPANGVPAAAVSTYARFEDRAAALASGFQLHITKPLNPSELVAAIASLLNV